MSDEKTMLPELLPVPKPVIPSVNARERVVKHWHTLMTAGAATAALAGCGCLVMDPLPPPPQCRTTRSLLANLSFRVAPNGGRVELFVDWLDWRGDSSLTFLSIEGGTVFTQPSSPIRDSDSMIITPSGTGPITVIFATQCEGTAATSIRVVITPQGAPDAGTTTWIVNATDL